MKKFLLLLLLPSVSYAGLINYQISGEITEIRATDVTSVSVGDPWSVDLTILSSSGDLWSGPRGLFRIDWNGELRLGTEVFPIQNVNTGSPGNAIALIPGATSLSEIDILVQFAEFASLDGIQANLIEVQLFNPIVTSLSDDLIESTLDFQLNPPLDQSFFVLSLAFFQSIQGDVQSFAASEIKPIPLPGTIYLFVLPFIMLLCGRCLKRDDALGA